MRTHVLVAAMLAALSFGYCASAANTPESATTSYKGLWISTPYPSVGVAANESVELDLTLRNAGMPPQAFSYDVTLINESGREAVARLDAAAPPGFRVTFKEGFGSQELTSVPV